MTLPDPNAWDLASFAVAFVAGSLVTLRVGPRGELPCSYGVAIAALRVLSVGQVVALALPAHLVAGVVRRRDPGGILATGWHAAAITLGGGAFLAVSRGLNGADEAFKVTTAGAGATIAMLAVAWADRMRRGDRRRPGAGVPGAMLVLGASGTLMALAYRGTGGASLGAWSLALFAIPMLASRYALEHASAARATFDDTITALSVVPELAGVVPEGDARRLADLAVAVGRKSGLPERGLHELERAALVHHLGYTVIEDTSFDVPTLEPFAVARATATLVRDSRGLEKTEQLLRGMATPAGRMPDEFGPRESKGAQVLRVVAAFQHLSGGRPERAGRALEHIIRDTGTEYDSRAVMALVRHVLRGFEGEPFHPHEVSRGDRPSW